MNERIKKLRKALDLTQQEFADHIGVKRNTIATYEIGRNTPLDAVISSICREFNVSEKWLRAGEGEMFTSAAKDTLGELCAELNATELEEQIMRAYFQIDAKIRGPFMRQLLQEVQATVSTTRVGTVQAWEPEEEPHTSSRPVHPLTINEKVEIYRQQLLLEEEREKQASSANASGVV